jgi:hypothetical protein
MSNLYRGPSIDASYQVSVHLFKRFQRRRFKKFGQSETRIACGGLMFVGCFIVTVTTKQLIESMEEVWRSNFN